MDKSLQILSNASGTNMELLNIKVSSGVGDIVVQLDVFDEQNRVNRQGRPDSINLDSHLDIFHAISRQIENTPHKLAFLNILQHLICIDNKNDIGDVLWDTAEKLVHRAIQLDNPEEAECLLRTAITHGFSCQNCSGDALRSIDKTKEVVDVQEPSPLPAPDPDEKLSVVPQTTKPPPASGPPPIPGGPGGPPPPPPLFNVGLQTKEYAPKPTIKMKTLNWKKIAQHEMLGKTNLWSMLANKHHYNCLEVIDFKGMEGLFSLTVKKLDCVDGKKKKEPTTIHLLESIHSLKLNIFLSQFKQYSSDEDIVQLIRNDDHKAMGPEKLKDLRKYLPDEQLYEVLQSKKDEPRLARAEKFLVLLIDVPNYALRIESMLLKEEFAINVTYLEPLISSMFKAGDDIKNNEALHKVLSIIMIIGNFLNSGGYAGNAAGFKLSSLNTIAEIQANKTGMNLLHFIAQEVEKYDSDLLNFTTELIFLENVSKINVEQITKDINDLDVPLQGIKNEIETTACDETFHKQMGEFLKSAESQIGHLKNGMIELESMRLVLCNFFCEDAPNFKLEECFGIIHKFCVKFTAAVKENEKRKHKENQAQLRERQNQETLSRKSKYTSSPDVNVNPTLPVKRLRNRNRKASLEKPDLLKFLHSDSRERPTSVVPIEDNVQENSLANEAKQIQKPLPKPIDVSAVDKCCLAKSTTDPNATGDSLQIIIRSNTEFKKESDLAKRSAAIVEVIQTPKPQTQSLFNFPPIKSSQNDTKSFENPIHSNGVKNELISYNNTNVNKPDLEIETQIKRNSRTRNFMRLKIPTDCANENLSVPEDWNEKNSEHQDLNVASLSTNELKLDQKRAKFQRRYSSINDEDIKLVIEHLNKTPTLNKTKFSFRPQTSSVEGSKFVFRPICESLPLSSLAMPNRTDQALKDDYCAEKKNAKITDEHTHFSIESNNGNSLTEFKTTDKNHKDLQENQSEILCDSPTNKNCLEKCKSIVDLKKIEPEMSREEINSTSDGNSTILTHNATANDESKENALNENLCTIITKSLSQEQNKQITEQHSPALDEISTSLAEAEMPQKPTFSSRISNKLQMPIKKLRSLSPTKSKNNSAVKATNWLYKRAVHLDELEPKIKSEEISSTSNGFAIVTPSLAMTHNATSAELSNENILNEHLSTKSTPKSPSQVMNKPMNNLTNGNNSAVVPSPTIDEIVASVVDAKMPQKTTSPSRISNKLPMSIGKPTSKSKTISEVKATNWLNKGTVNLEKLDPERKKEESNDNSLVKPSTTKTHNTTAADVSNEITNTPKIPSQNLNKQTPTGDEIVPSGIEAKMPQKSTFSSRISNKLQMNKRTVNLEKIEPDIRREESDDNSLVKPSTTKTNNTAAAEVSNEIIITPSTPSQNLNKQTKNLSPAGDELTAGEIESKIPQKPTFSSRISNKLQMPIKKLRSLSPTKSNHNSEVNATNRSSNSIPNDEKPKSTLQRLAQTLHFTKKSTSTKSTATVSNKELSSTPSTGSPRASSTLDRTKLILNKKIQNPEESTGSCQTIQSSDSKLSLGKTSLSLADPHSNSTNRAVNSNKSFISKNINTAKAKTSAIDSRSSIEAKSKTKPNTAATNSVSTINRRTSVNSTILKNAKMESSLAPKGDNVAHSTLQSRSSTHNASINKKTNTKMGTASSLSNLIIRNEQRSNLNGNFLKALSSSKSNPKTKTKNETESGKSAIKRSSSLKTLSLKNSTTGTLLNTSTISSNSEQRKGSLTKSSIKSFKNVNNIGPVNRKLSVPISSTNSVQRRGSMSKTSKDHPVSSSINSTNSEQRRHSLTKSSIKSVKNVTNTGPIQRKLSLPISATNSVQRKGSMSKTSKDHPVSSNTISSTSEQRRGSFTKSSIKSVQNVTNTGPIQRKLSIPISATNSRQRKDSMSNNSKDHPVSSNTISSKSEQRRGSLTKSSIKSVKNVTKTAPISSTNSVQHRDSLSQTSTDTVALNCSSTKPNHNITQRYLDGDAAPLPGVVRNITILRKEPSDNKSPPRTAVNIKATILKPFSKNSKSSLTIQQKSHK